MPNGYTSQLLHHLLLYLLMTFPFLVCMIIITIDVLSMLKRKLRLSGKHAGLGNTAFLTSIFDCNLDCNGVGISENHVVLS